MHRQFCSALVLSVVLTGCDSGGANNQRTLDSAAATPAQLTSERWETFATSFVDDTLRLLPHLAVGRGRHEYDGVQTDYSPRGLAAREALYERALEVSARFSGLTAQQRYDRELLQWYARRALFLMREQQTHRRNVTTYFGALSPDIYVSRDYAPLDVRMRALVKHTQGVPNLLRQMRENLETPLPAPHIDRALGFFGGLIPFFEDTIPEIFVDVSDAQLHAALDEASAAAIHAFRDTLIWLREQQLNATDSFRLGADLFERRLQLVEYVDLDIAAFKAKGEADLARNLDTLRAACDEVEAGIELPTCVERVEAVKPEGGAVAGARAQLASLRAFMLEQDLVGIPSEDEARVEAAPPHRRSNSAYINLRGPYEGPEVASTYYIAPPDPTWSAAERAAYIPGKAGLQSTSVHEVWPGHFLHNLYIAAAPSEARQVLRSGGFSEGWAHYAEELMIEAGLGKDDPFIRIGQVAKALLRNVRYLCAVGMHAEQMTQAECEQMFLDVGFQDPGNARQQAARGTYDPGYYSYTLHKLLIRELREQWTAQRGGRRAWRAFHEALLALGSPPTGLAAAHLLAPGQGQ